MRFLLGTFGASFAYSALCALLCGDKWDWAILLGLILLLGLIGAVASGGIRARWR